MATPATIAAALDAAARNPKAVSTDKGKVESHDIGSILAALRQESAATAVGKNHFGLRFVKIES
ncbi:MAG: hypothetical protein ACYTFQ_30355, partial [Planctomycetota bacterium]